MNITLIQLKTWFFKLDEIYFPYLNVSFIPIQSFITRIVGGHERSCESSSIFRGHQIIWSVMAIDWTIKDSPTFSSSYNTIGWGTIVGTRPSTIGHATEFKAFKFKLLTEYVVVWFAIKQIINNLFIIVTIRISIPSTYACLTLCRQVNAVEIVVVDVTVVVVLNKITKHRC